MKISGSQSSLPIQRMMSEQAQKIARSLERLSSGSRINRASDDAAGLSIANNLEAETRSLRNSVRQLNDAKSVLNTADTGLSAQLEIVQRIRELAVQAANGSLSNSDREMINKEVVEALTEFQRISDSTEMNGLKLLDGTQSQISVLAGDSLQSKVEIDLADSQSSTVFTTRRGGQFQDDQPILSTAGYAESITHGDLNGDGIEDLVITDYDNSRILIMLGEADGSHSVAATLSGITEVTSVATGDFNGDGTLDFAVSRAQDPARVYLNSGDGLNFDMQTVSNSSFFYRIESGDMDGDGIYDLFLLNGASISYIQGNRSETYSAVNSSYQGDSLILGSFTSGMQFGDFNGDGLIDFATTGHSFDQLAVGLGDGQGSFYVSQTDLNADAGNLAVGDLNGDGRTDIVATTGAGLQLYEGDGDGGFALTQVLDLPGSHLAAIVKFADITHNGFQDIYISGNWGRSFYEQKPDRSFNLKEIDTAIYADPEFVDLNGDSFLDMAYISLANLNFTYAVGVETNYQSEISVQTQSEAQNLIGLMDEAQDRIIESRSKLGASLGRLDSAISVNLLSVENLEAAKSQILDADIAIETSNLISAQVQQQATTAAFAQSNLGMQMVLSLLR